LPPVDPSQFACFSDPTDCREQDFCDMGACTPRLDCALPNAALPGCDPEQSCELMNLRCKRCDATLAYYVAAVTCQSGIHTTTSTRPKNLDTCDCPDGTYCVAFADGAFPPGAYPLFVVPAKMSLPIGKLGFAKDKPEFRICARVCSSELDCSSNHTCRAAAVVGPDLYANRTSTRHTIGVCYPDLFPITTSTAVVAMPDPMACASEAECPAKGVHGPCTYEGMVVPDHPTVPAGPAWIPDQHRALVPHCVSAAGNNLNGDDIGCTNDTECRSGVCAPNGRCAIPCNPHISKSCDPPRRCEDLRLSVNLASGGKVVDRVQICSPR
jgi:hypothetical protein